MTRAEADKLVKKIAGPLAYASPYGTGKAVLLNCRQSRLVVSFGTSWKDAIESLRAYVRQVKDGKAN